MSGMADPLLNEIGEDSLKFVVVHIALFFCPSGSIRTVIR